MGSLSRCGWHRFRATGKDRALFPGRNLGGFANPISLTWFLRDPLAHLIFCRWPLRGDGDKYTLRSGNQQPTTISNYLSCGRVSCVSSPARFHSYRRTPLRSTITISVQPRTLWGCFFNSSLRIGLWIHATIRQVCASIEYWCIIIICFYVLRYNLTQGFKTDCFHVYFQLFGNNVSNFTY